MSTPTISPSEWKTRRSLIDPKLNALGWNIVKKVGTTAADVFFDDAATTEFYTENGPADYALCNGGRVIGIVEAKRMAVSPAGVLEQAVRSARGLPAGGFDVDGMRAPFLYATNGEIIHFHDVRDPLNRSRKLKRFHTPAALEELLARNFAGACQWFAANPNNHSWLRPYQREANAALKRAANASEPILTADERAARAITLATAGTTPPPE